MVLYAVRRKFLRLFSARGPVHVGSGYARRDEPVITRAVAVRGIRGRELNLDAVFQRQPDLVAAALPDQGGAAFVQVEPSLAGITLFLIPSSQQGVFADFGRRCGRCLRPERNTPG